MEAVPDDVIDAILTASVKSKTATENYPRTFEVWYKKLQHRIGVDCDRGENCLDPRRGELPQITAKVGKEYLCRRCFLNGAA